MYKTGKIDKFWNDDIYRFPYKIPKLNEQLANLWERQGYKVNAWGSSHPFNEDLPYWTKNIHKIFDLNNMTFAFYKMQNLEYMPTHVDHFSTYQKLYNIEKEKINRIILFLEDWKSGHYFEIENTIIPYWTAGTYVLYDYNTEHAAGNFGNTPRYTLQITGHV